MNNNQSICTICEWDSSFFALRIAQVNVRSLSLQSAEAIEKWCERNFIDCLYFLAEGSDTASIHIAEASGFHLVDIRLTLETSLAKEKEEPILAPPGVVVRSMESCDFAALVAIARKSHTSSRFFKDRNFSRERCADMYAVWMEKCVAAPDTAVFTAMLYDTPAGYICCRKTLGSMGQIVLAGVDERARNRGVGTRLLHVAKEWFRTNGLAAAFVVTQGANIQALRLYTKMGFYPMNVQLWYHRWFGR